MSLIIILHICVLFAGEFDHAINLSRPKLIFASSAVIKRAARISEKNAFVQKVILIDSASNGKKFTSKITTSYDKLIGSIKVGVVLIILNFLLSQMTHFSMGKCNFFQLFRHMCVIITSGTCATDDIPHFVKTIH